MIGGETLYIPITMEYCDSVPCPFIYTASVAFPWHIKQELTKQATRGGHHRSTLQYCIYCGIPYFPVLQTLVEYGQAHQFDPLHTTILVVSDSLKFYQLLQQSVEDGGNHPSYTHIILSHEFIIYSYPSKVLRFGTLSMSLILGASEDIFYNSYFQNLFINYKYCVITSSSFSIDCSFSAMIMCINS